MGRKNAIDFQYTKLTLVVMSVVLCAQSNASITNALKTLVPAQYIVMETLHGDLNKDNEADAVLVVKARNPKMIVKNQFGIVVDQNRRGLLIALKTASGYEVLMQNLNCLDSENEDGGIYFPPDLVVEVKRGNLIISVLHGRYGFWRYTFRRVESDFHLIGYDRSIDDGPNVKSTFSINFLSNKILRKTNTNPDSVGGDERFIEAWSTIKNPKVIKLSSIKDFHKLTLDMDLIKQ